jgi:hypothetical protein
MQPYPSTGCPIRPAAEEYLSSLSGCKNTKKEHRHSVREFVAWNANVCEYELRKQFVDEINKAHLMRFMDYLIDDEPENGPFTAAWKLLRGIMPCPPALPSRSHGGRGLDLNALIK